MVRSSHKGEYAGIASRGAALVIDIILVTVGVLTINWLISLPIEFFFSTDIASCAAGGAGERRVLYWACYAISIAWVVIPLVVAPLYFIFLFWTSGQTIGKYVMGLRVVRLDGAPMTLLGSIVRWFGYFASALPLGLGFLWVTVDTRRLGFHDHLAHTCVIYAWQARDDAFTLERIRRWFRRGWRASAFPTASGSKNTAITGTTHGGETHGGAAHVNHDAVAVTVQHYGELAPILDRLQALIRGDKLAILSVMVLAKDAEGDIGLVGAAALDAGGRYTSLPGLDHDIHTAQLERIKRELPADRFIVLVLLQSRFAEVFAREVRPVTSGLIGRYDLGDDLDSVLDAEPDLPSLIGPSSL
jgi:uncharacterized RDD family membrane protein YckC